MRSWRSASRTAITKSCSKNSSPSCRLWPRVKRLKAEWGGRLVSSPIKFMVYFARIIAGVAFVTLLVSLGPATAAADQIVDQVVATVDGDPITMHDLTKYAAAAGVQLPPDDSPGSMEIKRHLLENLIGEKLVDHEMSTIEVDDDQVDRFIAQFEAGNHITDAELRAQLAQHGISYESYRKRARQEVQKMTMIEQQ